MNPNQPGNSKRRFGELAGLLLLIALSPLLLPLFVVLGVSYLAFALTVHMAVWLLWCTRGKFILFVYSDSPIWKEHILEHVLPRIRDYSVVLNWSERDKWRRWFSLRVMAFRVFGGPGKSNPFGREFNPMGVVFRPFRTSKTFRFWKPFKDFKHGKTEPLVKMENEFFALVDSIIGKTPA